MTKYLSQAERNELLFNVLALFAAFAILFFFHLEKPGLFDVDEAIFAQASVEMLADEDFVAPSYNGEPRYHKPPLIYWAQAISMKTFGETPFSARLPSAIFAFLTVVMFYMFIEGMTRNKQLAIYATAIMGINLSFLIVAKAAIADMALNFFMLAAILTLIANIYAEKRALMPVFIAGVMLGLGLLTKGPIALLIPGIVVGFVVFVRGNIGYNLKCVNPLILLVAIAVVLVPWCQMIIDERGIDFFREFILVHNIERYVDGLGNSNSSSYYYYLIVLCVGFFPWVMLIPSAICGIMPSFIRRLRSDKAEDALPVIGFIWAIAVIAFFSFSATKFAHYIVPALPGLALLIGARVMDMGNNPLSKFNWLWMIPLTLLISVPFLLFKFIPNGLVGKGGDMILKGFSELSSRLNFDWPLTDPLLINILSQDIHISIAPVMIGAIMITGMVMGIGLLTSGHKQGAGMMGICMWLILILINIGVVPTVYDYMQKPLANLAEEIKNRSVEVDEVYYVSLHQPSLRFISGVEFIPVDSASQVAEAARRNVRQIYMVEEHKKYKVLDFIDNRVADLICEGGYCLIDVQKSNSGRRY